MFAKERHSKIVDILNKQQSVTVPELSELFGVSAETVRRDLLELENQGMLTRAHGGAMSLRNMQVISTLSQRNSENIGQKRSLCEYACKYISDNDVIMIDSGSTAIHLAHAIKASEKRLTVITNSPDVIGILAEASGVDILAIGGNLVKTENALCGPVAQEQILRLHAHKSFIFPSGIGKDGYAYTLSAELYGVEKAMLASCDKAFILADSSKFMQFAPIRLCRIEPSQLLITDKSIKNETIKYFKEQNINIIF